MVLPIHSNIFSGISEYLLIEIRPFSSASRIASYASGTNSEPETVTGALLEAAFGILISKPESVILSALYIYPETPL